MFARSKFILYREHKYLIRHTASLDEKVLSLIGLTTGLIALILPLAFVGTLLIGVILNGLHNLHRDHQFLAEGREAMARVTRCKMIKTFRDGFDHPQFNYIYTVNEHSYSEKVELPEGASCEVYPVLGWVPMAYLASDPSVSRFDGLTTPSFSLLHLVLILLLLPLTLGLLIMTHHTIVSYLHARRLNACATLTDGVWLEGHILSIEGAAHEGDFTVRLHYEFETPYKRMITGSCEAERNDLKDQVLPSVGSPITIFYVDDQIYKVL